MKFKKRKFVSTIGAIALVGIVVVPTLTLTSCSGGSSTPTATTTFTIYGESTINGIAGLSSTSSYSAVDNIGNDVTNNSTWSLVGAPDGVSINNGTLNWTSSLPTNTYPFAIRCVSGTLTGQDKSVILTITTPKPTPTSINVYGAPTINGVVGTAGNMQYTATNNDGEAITSPTWSLTTPPNGVSINNSGLLSWTANAAAGTFTINCAADGLTTGALNVTLNITTPKPTPTSINVYGAPTINGVAGIAGSLQYTATNNNGESLTSPTWILITPPSGVSINNSGLLRWTSGAAADTFTIICTANGLTTGTLQVTLNIFASSEKPIPFTDEYFTWTTSGDALTVDGLQSGVDLSNYNTLQIPASYADSTNRTYFVTAIGDEAFDNLFNASGYDTIINLDLTISINLNSIGYAAFRNCSGFTSSLIISGSVTSIGDYAFYQCSGFTGSLTIPNSVTSIGIGAFRGCSGFTSSLTIPNSVTSIGSSAFFQCSGFTGSLTIPNSVSIIGTSAFYGCTGFNGTLTIGNSVISIGTGAFAYCSDLNGTLTIGNSVTNIGQFAFATTKFTDVINYSPNFNFADNVGNAKVLIPASSGTSLDYENGSVVGCIAFGQLTIPNSVTSIGEELFNGCSGLTGSLTIGNLVTNIGEYAFFDCSGFTGSLTIPDSVTSIGSEAFQLCSGFNTINVSTWTTVPTIGAMSFSGFQTDGTVIVPANYTIIGISLDTFAGLPDTWQLQVV